MTRIQTSPEHESGEGLSARDRLKAKLRQRKDVVGSRIEKVDGGAKVLSYPQQRMWLLDRLMGPNPAYNISFAIRLSGELDVDLLSGCLNTIVGRHEALRTRFVAHEEQTGIVVDEAPDLRLRIEPVAGLDEVHAVWFQERSHLFDIGSESLFRTRLLRESTDSHVLVVTMHHIVSDAWSLGVFFRELVTLYSDLGGGRPSSLPELPIQYSDYALWQREWLQGAALGEHTRYWEKQLAGAPPLLLLPTDRPRPAEQDYRGATEAVHIPLELCGALHELSKGNGATLFMCLLSCFSLLLGRYAGQHDVVVGAPIANRTRREVENLIGFFVNTLVMRTDLSGDPTFIQLLGRVRETALQAYAHQDLPFEHLVEALKPERSLSYGPLIQVMFILQNAPMGNVSLEGIKVSSLGSERMDGFSRFDITLSLAEGTDGIKGIFEYNTDLFDRATIKRMVGHFVALVHAAAAAPHAHLSQLDFLDASERQWQLEKNDTAASIPFASVHEAVAAQARLTPDALAVKDEAAAISYRTLDDRANRLAIQLLRDGHKVGGLVGICMERTVDMVVAMLAVLKAGGAYVPIDPDYPLARIAYIVEHARLRRIIAPASIPARLSAPQSPLAGFGGWLPFDESTPTAAGASDCAHLLPMGITGDHRAYIIYTSGSTGVPKGVVGRHGSLVNRLFWMHRRYPAQVQEVFCQKTGVSFVDHVAEIFQPLTCGAALVILPAPSTLSPPEFLDTLRRHRISRLTVVPSLLDAMLADSGSQACPDLRLLISSGEPLVLRDRQAFGRHFPDAHLVNLYGSTEVGADATFHELSSLDAGPVPIGRAIANTHLHVLGSSGEMLPQGAVGELFVGGEGLAQGYLHQPALTARYFVPDPHSAVPGARMYRTGDLVRYRADGELEYLGRRDHQVNIRGFRIELAEIDAVLRQHACVEAAVTIVHIAATSGPQLVAYIACNRAQDDISGLVDEITAHLKARLPHYMVPTLIQRIDALPLTATGKIDRAALPAPVVLHRVHEDPLGEHELLLAGLWCDVLRRDRVGRNDNFFELGGHSLLVTQLTSRIADRLGVVVPLLGIFEHQELRSQAGFIASLGTAATSTDGSRVERLPRLDAVTRSQPQPLSHAQHRLWFLHQLMGPSAGYNIPLAIELVGRLDIEAFTHAFNRLVERHESLRTAFQDGAVTPLQRILPHVDRTYAVEWFEDAAALACEVHNERMHRFELGGEPPVRVRLLRDRSATHERHALLVTVHHIIADGWSLGVLLRDFSRLYQAFRAGTEPELARLDIQYLDFAAWQRDWLAKGALQEQLAYWQRQLADLPPVLELPLSRPRPPEQSLRGSGVDFVLDRALAERINALARGNGVTLFMTLMATFAVLLRRYSGQEDIAIGTPIANRRWAETEDVFGYFANTLVMRNDLSGDPGFSEVLLRTRRMALDAYAHQDVPFEQLVDALKPLRSLSYSPLFQVMFVLQNAPYDVQKLDDLSVSALAADASDGVSRFDLHLAMGEVNGGLTGRMEYNSEIFDRPRVEQIIAHFENLLRAVVDAPDRGIEHYEFLSPQERSFQLVALNSTEKDYPRDASLKGLFEAQVERTPDAVALVFHGETLTYRQLNLRANRLAHHLIAQGVRPDDRVGLYAQRSLQMVIGIYGIIKAGAAYLPLDPEYPDERVHHIIEEAGVRFVVSHGDLAAGFSGADHVVDADVPGMPDLAGTEANPSVPELTSRHLAYVIYTSGSTGKPKGVMVEHRAAVNRIAWMQDEYLLQPADVVLQKTPFSFDVSVWEFVWPLVVGARLVIAAPQGHRDPDYLVDLIRQEGVTTLHFVPSMLQALLALGRWGSCGSVRQVFCSGEALSPELVREFFASGSGAELHNLYGPTEAAIDVSYWHCLDGEQPPAIPIGKPIQNTQLHIVDQHLQLVPAGAPGELIICGDGLARGYIGQPELTDEKFVAATFTGDSRIRGYRTGDLVRRLPGGEIEYLGRLDNQVKINGFRIELGEIESHLDGVGGIRKSVVIAHAPPGESARLVAYLVLEQPGTGVPQASIDKRLAEALPAFMIPRVYIAIDAVPLTSSGKLDRKRLPAPSEKHLHGSPQTPPRTELERRLLDVWKRNLAIERLGVMDNYFSMGGDSIRCIALVALAREEGIVFQVKDLFMHPTVATLAEAIDGSRLQPDQQAPVPDAFDLISDEERRTLLEHYS